MWIDLKEGCLPELLAKGWSINNGNGKTYLVAPDGMRLPMRKSPAALNLYVAHALDSTRFKVGVTREGERRRRALQTGSPFKLEFICIVEIESQEVETKAHDLLLRWHCHGEWFDLRQQANAFRRAVQRCQEVTEVSPYPIQALPAHMRAAWCLARSRYMPPFRCHRAAASLSEVCQQHRSRRPAFAAKSRRLFS